MLKEMPLTTQTSTVCHSLYTLISLRMALKASLHSKCVCVYACVCECVCLKSDTCREKEREVHGEFSPVHNDCSQVTDKNNGNT